MFFLGLARACGGALVFSLPMLMTMEMWQLGFSLSHVRLALLLLVTLPLLVGLSHYMGYEATFGWQEDVVDAFVAVAVGFIVPALILSLFAIVTSAMPLNEIVGKISLQAVPASIGAMFAQSELGSRQAEQGPKQRHAGYGGEIFIMAAGALFLGLNVAPTEEMVLLAYKTSAWHSVAIALVSLLVMHAFVYAVEFQGQAEIPPGTPFGSVFIRFTVVGYAVVLVISFYLLWTFGRLEGFAFRQILSMLVVLGFPCAVGAAAARLLL
jgi:putative integral membrane protein (TIGR02587 family)